MFSRPDFIDLSTVRGDLPNPKQTNFVRASLCQYQLNHQPDSPGILTAIPLTIQKGARYPLRAFSTWWEKLTVLLVGSQYALSRQDVVTLLADTDGGAHVDPNIQQRLALLKRKEALPLRVFIKMPDGSRKEYVAQVDQIMAATVRTIAEETRFIFETRVMPYCEKYISY
ncbi:MAG TPA: hypothetical protein IAA58_11575 [Candidatus Gallacutalibacter stercoravium]|nr:hypothetical protein [Candidatus Gallacutalibacter stercoravium]